MAPRFNRFKMRPLKEIPQDFNEIKHLKFIANIAKCLFIAPLLPPKSGFCDYSFKLICLTIYFCEMGATYISVHEILRELSADGSKSTLKKMALFTFVTMACFDLSETLNILLNGKQWVQLYEKIQEIDSTLYKSDFKQPQNNSHQANLFIGTFLIGFCITCHRFIWSISNIFKTIKWNNYLDLIISRTYIIFFVSNFEVIALNIYLRRRYNFLKKLVTIILGDSRLPSSLKVRKIHNISKLCRNLWELVQTTNAIFGYTLLFAIIMSVQNILGAFVYWIELDGSQKDYDIFKHFSFIGPSLLTMVMLILLFSVMLGCESVMKACESFSNKCHLTRRNIHEYDLSLELLFIAEYSAELRPEFQATCLMINQKLLSSFVYFVIMYLIVVMQFNTAK